MSEYGDKITAAIAKLAAGLPGSAEVKAQIVALQSATDSLVIRINDNDLSDAERTATIAELQAKTLELAEALANAPPVEPEA